MVQHNSIDHSALLSVSYASNSTSVSFTSAAGASTLVSRADHVHKQRTFHGVRAIPNAGTVMTTANTEYPIAFAGVDTYDTDAFHDPASNNTRITIPAGLAGYYVFTAMLYVPITAGTTNYLDLKFRLGGAAGTVIAQARDNPAGDGNPIMQLVSAPYSLAAGNYVELYAMTNVASRTTDSTTAWFAAQLVGIT